jgi:PKD repeat protein
MDSADVRVAGRTDTFAWAQARARPSRIAIALIVVGLLAVLGWGAAPAGAKIVTDSVTQHKFGVVPTTTAPRPSNTACIADHTDCTLLTYHGGAVMHAQKFYMLFWTPSGHGLPSAYKAGLNSWMNEVAAADYTAGNLFSVDQQFYDTLSGPKRFVPYAITNGGSLVDTAPYPANACSDNGLPVCLTDAQITAEIKKYVTAHSLPTGPSTEYFLFTPHNVGSCFDGTSSTCAYTGYCGYHSYIGTARSSTEILYSNMPWAYNVSGCDVNLAFGTGYANGDAIDPVVGVLSHEASETMTDPNLDAWYQNGGTDSGFENGDKCAYVYGNGGYGSTTGLLNNGLGFYNYTLSPDQYLMQLEWDQRLTNCSRTNTDKQPIVTITPTTATHGVARTFTAHVTDAAGINTIAWAFGDGASATTTAATVSHTYATAGTKSMTVIVTDGHGNTKKVVQAITVS